VFYQFGVLAAATERRAAFTRSFRCRTVCPRFPIATYDDAGGVDKQTKTEDTLLLVLWLCGNVGTPIAPAPHTNPVSATRVHLIEPFNMPTP
jgi:hypothetical protein